MHPGRGGEWRIILSTLFEGRVGLNPFQTWGRRHG